MTLKNLLFITIAVIGIVAMLGALSAGDPGTPFANTVRNPDPANTLVWDSGDPYFRWAGSGAVLLAIVLMVGLWMVGPHPNSTTSTGKAMFAAVVLCACLFGLAYLSHSGQNEIINALWGR